MPGCALIDDFAERKQMLQDCLGTLVGQQAAIEEFRRLAVAKLQSMDSTNLVVLIVGDSGTGKTSMGIALSLSISYSTGQAPLRAGDCLVLIDCSKYKEPRDSAHVVQMIEQIEHDVAQRMRKCAESVILVEDLTLMDSRVREGLVPSLAKGFPQRDSDGNLISGLKLSVIITSNFGHMNRTRGWTREQVRTDAQGTNLKVFGTLVHENVIIVPLVAYEENDFRAIAHQMMQNEVCDTLRYANFECLVYPRALVDSVASAAYQDGHLRSKNARGVWELLDRNLLWIARDASMAPLNRPSEGWFGDPNVYDLVFHSKEYPVKSISNGPDLQVSSLSRPKGSSSPRHDL